MLDKIVEPHRNSAEQTGQDACQDSSRERMMESARQVEDMARKVRLLVLDVDGVLTDGGLYYDANGLSIKRFDVHDGIGIRLLQSVGLEVAVISGMSVPCVDRRLEVLGVTENHGGYDNKATVLQEILTRKGLDWAQVAYLGDDWVDMAPMLRVGLPVAVANARPEVKEIAHIVTHAQGGRGAVRELCDFILTCQGRKEELVENWKHLV